MPVPDGEDILVFTSCVVNVDDAVGEVLRFYPLENDYAIWILIGFPSDLFVDASSPDCSIASHVERDHVIGTSMHHVVTVPIMLISSHKRRTA